MMGTSLRGTNALYKFGGRTKTCLFLAFAFVGAARGSLLRSPTPESAGGATHRYINSFAGNPVCTNAAVPVTALRDVGVSTSAVDLAGNFTCHPVHGVVTNGILLTRPTNGFSAVMSPSDGQSGVSFVVTGMLYVNSLSVNNLLSFVPNTLKHLAFRISVVGGVLSITHGSCGAQRYLPLNGLGTMAFGTVRPLVPTPYTLVVTISERNGMRVIVNGLQFARQSDSPFSETAGCRHGSYGVWTGEPGVLSITAQPATNVVQHGLSDVQTYNRALPVLEALALFSSNVTMAPPPPINTSPPPAFGFASGAFGAYTVAPGMSHRYIGSSTSSALARGGVIVDTVADLHAVVAFTSAGTASDVIDPSLNYVMLRMNMGLEFGNELFASGVPGGAVRLLLSASNALHSAQSHVLTVMSHNYVFAVTFSQPPTGGFVTTFTATNTITGASATRSTMASSANAAAFLSATTPKYLSITYGTSGVYFFANEQVLAAFPTIMPPLYAGQHYAFLGVYFHSVHPTGVSPLVLNVYDIQVYDAALKNEVLQQMAIGIRPAISS